MTTRLNSTTRVQSTLRTKISANLVIILEREAVVDELAANIDTRILVEGLDVARLGVHDEIYAGRVAAAVIDV